jgi:nucleoside-diphosphate-sugar epimerase
MKAYLVTGGAGFIGSHLTEELVRRGHRVRVLDNFLTGKRENLDPFRAKIELIEGDIRDLGTCRKAVAGMDYVLHEAALTSVLRSVEDPLATNEINIRGTLNVLWAAAEAKVKKVVFASSSAAYGDDQRLPKKEGVEGMPLSPYGLSKNVGEKYCQVFSLLYGLSSVSLRYFNIFGPRQDPDSQYAAVIPLFITKILKGEPPTIFGDGEQSRDFTYVANVVEANILTTEAPDVADGVFNIACAERITVNALTARINEILGAQVKPRHDAPRPGDILHSFAAIGKAREKLKYNPLVGFREGLERTIAWYKERKGS